MKTPALGHGRWKQLGMELELGVDVGSESFGFVETLLVKGFAAKIQADRFVVRWTHVLLALFFDSSGTESILVFWHSCGNPINRIRWSQLHPAASGGRNQLDCAGSQSMAGLEQSIESAAIRAPTSAHAALQADFDPLKLEA